MSSRPPLWRSLTPARTVVSKLFVLSRRTSALHKAFGWSLSTPLVMLVASVATSSLVSRALGPFGFGQFSFGVTVITLLGALMSLGMPVTLVRAARATNPSDASHVESVAWGVVIVGGAVLAVSYVVLYRLTPVVRIPNAELWLGALLGAGAYGTSLNQMSAAKSQMAFDIQSYFWINAGGGLIRFALLAIALLLIPSASATTAISAVAAGWVFCGLAWAWPSARALISPGARRAVVSPETQREVLSFGIPVLGSTFVVAGIQNADLLFIGRSLNPSDLGLYAAGSRLLVAQSTLITAISTIALPVAAKAVASNAQAAFLKRTVWTGGAVGLVVTFLCVAASALVVRTIFGHAYARSAVVFDVLSAGVLLNFVSNPASQLLYAIGKPALLFMIHACQLLLLTVGLSFFATRFGIAGVAAWRAFTNTAAAVVILVLAVYWTRAAEPLAAVGAAQAIEA